MKTRKITSTAMESKRKATSDLNHDNWDNDEEPEERGTFQMASEDEIKGRVIKKARRKMSSDPEPGSALKSVFSGFSGFTNTASVATTVSGAGSPFSFLSKLSSTTSAKADTGKETKDEEKKFGFEKSNTYYAKLKGLNQNVSNWIKTHVDKNPLCILTPIFSDYEKYLKEIQEDKPEVSSAADTKLKFGNVANSKSDASSNDKAKMKSATNQFAFGPNSFVAAENKETLPDSSPVFGKSTAASESKIGDRLFKQPVDTSETSNPFHLFNTSSVFSSVKPAEAAEHVNAGFSFSNAKPFTFNYNNENKSKETAVTATKEDGEDEDEPPKVEFNLVVEEDSVYSKKCKVFVKNDSSYAERGIGMLYLKPIKGKGKTQLIVRADTNLGNILLNIILNESIPVQRLGKNNVMMVCIPTPESEPKPTSVLLRVKTDDEANDLLATINKFKKSTDE